MRALYISFILFALTTTITAQSTLDTFSLPSALIKENRLAIPFSDQSRSIQVIHASQIEQMPVRSVNDLLLFVAGVDVRQRGANGVQADIGIRGGTFDQTLILINGIKMVDPQTGHHSMNLPLDIRNIERIEVLKGPGARIYGQNAFSGAINIVTKKVTENQVNLSMRAGENSLWGASVTASHNGKNMQQLFSINHDQSDGYRYNTDYKISSIFYQNTLPTSNGSVSLTAGHVSRDFGANGFYASPDFMDQYEETRTSMVHLAYELNKGNWQITPRLSWRQNKDHYVFVRDNPSIYENFHTSQNFGGEIQASHTNKYGFTGIGLELNRISLSSNNLGERERTISSFFLEHRFNITERLDITPGVSFSHFTDFGNRFFPGIDIGYSLTDRIKIYANTGYTYRIPTFTDLYYEDRANNGNPDLEPESAISYEFGAKYDKGGLSIQTAVFQRDGLDNIDWTRVTDTVKWTPVNITELTTSGAEISLQAHLPVLLNRDVFIERLHFNYTYINTALEDNGEAFSRYALENLRHQLVAGFSYKILPTLTHSIYYRFTERVNLPSYHLVDTRINFQTKHIGLFAEASNLLDHSYKETNLVDMPGRWLRFGVNYRLK